MYEIPPKVLERVRDICLDLPEAKEVEAWGHPTFRAGKRMFAAIGWESAAGPIAIGLKVGHQRQAELLEDDRFFPTPYAAHQGWVSLRIDKQTDWDEVRQLAIEAYRQVALRRMIKKLDEQNA